MIFLQPKRWIDKPPTGVQINWGHPLTDDLEFCAVLNLVAYDLRRNGFAVLNNGPEWHPLGLNAPAGGTSFASWTDSQVGGDDPYFSNKGLTLVVGFFLRTGSYHFLGKHNGNGATQNPFDVSNSTTTFRVTRAGAGSPNYRAWQGGTLALGKQQQCAMTFADNLIERIPIMYIDGIPQSVSNPDGTGIGAVTGIAANLRVGRRADDVHQLDGIVRYVYIWSRPLLATELWSLMVDPYAFLLPQSPRIRYFFPSTFDPATMSGVSALTASGKMIGRQEV